MLNYIVFNVRLDKNCNTSRGYRINSIRSIYFIVMNKKFFGGKKMCFSYESYMNIMCILSRHAEA